MGTLIRIWKTKPMPSGATVGRNGTVTWTVKGKKRTGKLSGTGKVNVQSDTWTAQFTDETGTVRWVSTKTANRSVAEKILARYEAEVDRIKSGVVTRSELTKAEVRPITLDEALEQCRDMHCYMPFIDHVRVFEIGKSLITFSCGKTFSRFRHDNSVFRIGLYVHFVLLC